MLFNVTRYDIGSEWYPAFKLTISDDSELGNRVSFAEASSVLTTLTSDESRVTLSRFLDRWNNTASAWENGTLNDLQDTNHVISLSRLEPRVEQYLADVTSAQARGFESVFAEYNNAVNAYNTAEQQSQVFLLLSKRLYAFLLLATSRVKKL